MIFVIIVIPVLNFQLETTVNPKAKYLGVELRVTFRMIARDVP